jgi:hypothetical protein
VAPLSNGIAPVPDLMMTMMNPCYHPALYQQFNPNTNNVNLAMNANATSDDVRLAQELHNLLFSTMTNVDTAHPLDNCLSYVDAFATTPLPAPLSTSNDPWELATEVLSKPTPKQVTTNSGSSSFEVLQWRINTGSTS